VYVLPMATVLQTDLLRIPEGIMYCVVVLLNTDYNTDNTGNTDYLKCFYFFQ